MSSRTPHVAAEEIDEVVTPGTLTEALAVLRAYPDAVIAGGGTHLLFHPVPRDENRPILSVHAVQDLRRVARSEASVDIGSAVPLERLREVGQRFLPKPLIEALNQIGPPTVMNVATLGGALCISGIILPLTLVLQLLDARVEIRRFGHSRWATIAQLRDSDAAVRLNPGELVTRVRVPLRNWSSWFIVTHGKVYPADRDSLTIAAMVRVEKESINEARFSCVWRAGTLVRVREAEVDLLGRNVPLGARDLKILNEAWEAHPVFRNEMNALERRRVAGYLERFFSGLQPAD